MLVRFSAAVWNPGQNNVRSHQDSAPEHSAAGFLTSLCVPRADVRANHDNNPPTDEILLPTFPFQSLAKEQDDQVNIRPCPFKVQHTTNTTGRQTVWASYSNSKVTSRTLVLYSARATFSQHTSQNAHLSFLRLDVKNNRTTQTKHYTEDWLANFNLKKCVQQSNFSHLHGLKGSTQLLTACGERGVAGRWQAAVRWSGCSSGRGCAARVEPRSPGNGSTGSSCGACNRTTETSKRAFKARLSLGARTTFQDMVITRRPEETFLPPLPCADGMLARPANNIVKFSVSFWHVTWHHLD